MTSGFHFLPWVKSGLGSAVTVKDDLSANMSGRASFPVKFKVNNANEVSVDLEVYGPGHVSGIDSHVIARTDPPNHSVNFEPNYFPSVEFNRADFPWLFTPALGGVNERLRPWLVLVVVKVQDGVSISFDKLKPLPVLHINGSDVIKKELPNLTESWAWAHAQTISDAKTSIAESLSPESPLSVSRLLCPIKLQAKTTYHACLVPAFDVGRKTGLGIELAVDEHTLRPAWTLAEDVPDEISLPVYYQWQFSTATGGDFESLVLKLKGRSLPEDVGLREMNVTKQAFDIPAIGVMNFPSALKPPGLKNTKSIPKVFKKKLRELLNTTALPSLVSDEDPVVGPPIYGRFQANQTNLKKQAKPPVWMETLNLDPRNRVSASLGTRVIQDQQEMLMSSAWEQLSDTDEVLPKIKQAQFAHFVKTAITQKTVSRMSAADRIQFFTPAFKHMVVDTSVLGDESEHTKFITLHQGIAKSNLPTSLVSSTFRRILRPKGPIARRVENKTNSASEPIIRNRIMLRNTGSQPALMTSLTASRTVVASENTTSSSITSPVRLADSATFFANLISNAPEVGRVRAPETNDLSDKGLISFAQINSQISKLSRVHRVHLLTSTLPFTPRASEQGKRLLAASGSMIDYMNKTRPKPVKKPPFIWPGLMAYDFVVQAQVKENLTATKLLFIVSTTTTHDNNSVEENLDLHNTDSIVKHPVFFRPMYEPLKELSQDYILPGVDKIPENTVTLLETNPEFIEAYMAGLNHEMSRELLWREYPGDQRGTYFSDFWGRMGDYADKGDTIMPPIHQWQDDSELGEHILKDNTEGRLILLIRGELLQRYPDTLIYAVSHHDVHNKEKKDRSHIYPVLQGKFEPGIAFFGFNLTASEARGEGNDKGFYFVIEQAPTEIRFGLDVPQAFGADPAELGTWNDINWGHLAEDKSSFEHISHLEIENDRFPSPAKTIGKVTWGFNSAHQAKITQQLPMSMVLHAKLLLANEEA